MLTTNLSLRAGCATLALVLVAGCGGGSDNAEPKARTTATSAAPTTAAPSTPAVAERPKDDKSDGSAIAFSEYAINRIVGVTTGDDVDNVLTLATADCESCIDLAKQMKKDAVRQQFDGQPAVRDAKVIETSEDGERYLVEQVLAAPAGRKVDTATGKVASTFDETQFRFQVLLTWKDGKWVLTDYSSKKTS